MNNFQRLYKIQTVLKFLRIERPINKSYVLEFNRRRIIAFERCCSQQVPKRENEKSTDDVDQADYFKNLGLFLHTRKGSGEETTEPNDCRPSDSLTTPAADWSSGGPKSVSIPNAGDHSSENKETSLVSERTSSRNGDISYSANSTSTAVEKNEIADQSHLSANEDHHSFDPLAKGNITLDSLPLTFPSSFNLAAYVLKSTTLQKLVQLGVDLSRWDSMKDVPSLVIKLDFEKDMKPYIQFLHDVGVSSEELGKYLTKNPFIFKSDLEDLQVRINYLQSKNFSREAIARIVSKAPYFLNFTTKSIDNRLGFLQREFKLSGDEVRFVVTRFPKLILWELKKITDRQFSFKEEMGFQPHELKVLLLAQPKTWLLEHRSLLDRFSYIHNDMGIPHDLILQFPGCLLRRKFLMKQRHLFLKALNRDQYDPKKPGYVSLAAITTGSDSDFCSDVAKTSVKKYNEFLKTL